MIGAILVLVAYLLIESILFGVFALVISRKGKNSYDMGKAVLIIIAALILQSVLIMPILNYADLKITNQELVNILGTANVKELMGFDVTGIIMNLIEAGIGIFFGKKILNSVGY